MPKNDSPNYLKSKRLHAQFRSARIPTDNMQISIALPRGSRNRNNLNTNLIARILSSGEQCDGTRNTAESLSQRFPGVSGIVEVYSISRGIIPSKEDAMHIAARIVEPLPPTCLPPPPLRPFRLIEPSRTVNRGM